MVATCKDRIPMEETDQVCPVCGTQMVPVGEEYVRREPELGERLETVWSPDQQDDTCQLDHLLLPELLSADV